MQSNNTNFCEKLKLNYLYESIPNIFVTPEDAAGVTDGEVIAWVQSIGVDMAEVCAKESTDLLTYRLKPIKLHYQIQGKPNPCNFQCPSHLKCQAVNHNNTYCGCITSCPSNRNQFCGTDHVTYQNICHLHKFHCFSHGNNSATNVTIAYYGECQSK